jgi:hypothetical protein
VNNNNAKQEANNNNTKESEMSNSTNSINARQAKTTQGE